MENRDVEPQPEPQSDPSYFEPEINPFVADKMKRDKEFQDAAALQQQQLEPKAPEVSDAEPSVEDRLGELQRQNEEFRIQATKAQLRAARLEEKLRKKDSRLDQLQQQGPMVPMQQPVYDSRMMMGRNPDEPVLAQDLVNMMLSFAQAQGSRFNELQETIESLRGAKQQAAVIDEDTEAKLVAAHPWLLTLEETARSRAIADLHRTDTGTAAQKPATARPTPITGPQMEQARARVREVGYIETSNKGAQAERTMQSPARSAQAQKYAELKAALSRTDGKGAEQALKILADLGAGPQDDFDSGFAKMR